MNNNVTISATTDLNRKLAFMQYKGEEFFILEIDGETRAFEGTKKDAEQQYEDAKKDDETIIDGGVEFEQWVSENLTEINEESDDNFDDDYLVCTDEEADARWEESLDNYLQECVYPEIKDSTLQRYFDEEAWKKDARMDGRGHSLSGYDGNENEETVNGETFYIYRQN